MNQRKNIEADNRNVIIIKIKEINGFNYSNLHKVKAEIIKQFKDATGIDLSRSKIEKGPVDRFLGSI